MEDGAIDSAMACAAHAVAAADIHWSCPKGKPLSKYGWNLIARLRTYHEPSGYCVESRKANPRRYATFDAATAPDCASATSASPVEKASLFRYGFPDQPPSLRCNASNSLPARTIPSLGAPAHT